MELIPAFIPKSFQDLEEKMQTVKGLVPRVHIDITDGEWGVGEESWPFTGDRGQFRDIKNQELGFPLWDELEFEVHLMTKEPLSHVRDFIDAGATRIIIHVEALNYEEDIQFLDQLKTEGLVEIGIALNADTSPEEIKPYFQIADFIQVMTISDVGLQGAEFDPQGIDHIQWVKQNYKDMIVSVDGAMNEDTIPVAYDAGADRVVVGSAIFKKVNPREAIEELKSLV